MIPNINAYIPHSFPLISHGTSYIFKHEDSVLMLKVIFDRGELTLGVVMAITRFYELHTISIHDLSAASSSNDIVRRY